MILLLTPKLAYNAGADHLFKKGKGAGILLFDSAAFVSS
jgi:hypothetical protein